MIDSQLLKHTRVYQEAKEEGKLERKLEILPKLVKRGMSIQEIVELLDLDTEIIRKYFREQEIKLELVPKLVEKGMSIQEIAGLLDLDTETIRKYLRGQ